MSQPGIQSCFKPSPRPPPKSPHSPELRSLAEKNLEYNATHARLMLQWGLPPRVTKRKKGCPSYDARWLEGLHQVADLVASGKIREPPAIAIQLTCPEEFMMDGFSSALVVQHFEDLKSELPSWVEFPDPDLILTLRLLKTLILRLLISQAIRASCRSVLMFT